MQAKYETALMICNARDVVRVEDCIYFAPGVNKLAFRYVCSVRPLGEPLDQLFDVEHPRSTLHFRAVMVKQQCGYRSNVKTHRQCRRVVGVHLNEMDTARQPRGGASEVWCHRPARAAPGSPKIRDYGQWCERDKSIELRFVKLNGNARQQQRVAMPTSRLITLLGERSRIRREARGADMQRGFSLFRTFCEHFWQVVFVVAKLIACHRRVTASVT